MPKLGDMHMSRFFSFLLLAIILPINVFSQPAAQDSGGEGLDPNLQPTQASYEDFLKELGIASDDSVPEVILQEGFKVTLRVLNRHLSITTDLVFSDKSGKVYDGTLLIAVSACIQEHDDIPGNDAAFVTVRDRTGAVLFNGWMLRIFPSASVFEHPVYDILMRECAPTK